ncbi:MAG: hypothetical protein V3T01_09100 [Myxococcota bacterium]
MSAAPPHPSRRPWWMTALAAFCLATLGFLVARDLFVADVRNVEVWLGFEVRGTAALLTAPVHWAIFLVAAWAFWRGRPWIVPAAAAYSFYVALSHLIWSGVSPHGHGWPAGLVYAVVLSVPGFLLLRAHRLTTGIEPTATVGKTGAHGASVGVHE